MHHPNTKPNVLLGMQERWSQNMYAFYELRNIFQMMQTMFCSSACIGVVVYALIWPVTAWLYVYICWMYMKTAFPCSFTSPHITFPLPLGLLQTLHNLFVHHHQYQFPVSFHQLHLLLAFHQGWS